MISVEKRRVRGNLIEMFKMSENNDLFNNTFKFRKSESSRGNKLVFKTRCWFNIRKKFFTYRLVDIWNKFPDSAILINSLNSCKNNLDKINYCTCNYVCWYKMQFNIIFASWVFLFVVCSVLWPYYYLNLLFSSINCLLARNFFR